VKLNRDFLPRGAPIKEEMLLAPESEDCHDIDLKTRRNEVTGLRP
jgi:hypothetical protein